jgi:hypothetical protein
MTKWEKILKIINQIIINYLAILSVFSALYLLDEVNQ